MIKIKDRGKTCLIYCSKGVTTVIAVIFKKTLELQIYWWKFKWNITNLIDYSEKGKLPVPPIGLASTYDSGTFGKASSSLTVFSEITFLILWRSMFCLRADTSSTDRPNVNLTCPAEQNMNAAERNFEFLQQNKKLRVWTKTRCLWLLNAVCQAKQTSQHFFNTST